MRIGLGIDYHVFEEGLECVLGGCKIPVNYGFKAHSDGDILLHAIMDAILGAAALGDIGEHFPDDDIKYKDCDSKLLLEKVLDIIDKNNLKLKQLDATLISQKLILKKYKKDIKASLFSLLNIAENRINIKATTTEKMDDIGRGIGISCHCIVSLEEKEIK